MILTFEQKEIVLKALYQRLDILEGHEKRHTTHPIRVKEIKEIKTIIEKLGGK